MGRTPYRVWVSEVLLQQTRVDQAIPYFERFVRRFPDVDSLARARMSAVLKIWQGAGYYGRARRLHAAARILRQRYGGQLPRTPEALRELPGFGPYISAAVASLAYGAPVPALEANGLRVLARWHLVPTDPRRSSVHRDLDRRALTDLPPASAAAFNEALMELGERVCTPRAPRCPECPVARWCRARQELADPGAIPVPRARPPRPHVRAALAIIEHRGRWLVQRRPDSGFLGGLWEFPGGKIREGEAAEEAAQRELREETGLDRIALRPVGTVRHGYSHFTVELAVFGGRLGPTHGPVPLGRARKWVTPEQLARLPLPKATEKVIDLLTPQARPAPAEAASPG
ncbi:MAG TPA: NUDIX domain-containing protein [Thermoplasmata archaeon]|nr:NUDIX domain-containing protein [Thermoplasmata archaeon]